jgi:hypothetical protein
MAGAIGSQFEMTLREALESKKPFRRLGWIHWFKPDPLALALMRWSHRDILSDDWETADEAGLAYMPEPRPSASETKLVEASTT